MKIILIGMPGCGKTTIGKMAAEDMNLKFIDLDEEIVKSLGKSINSIFADSGEEVFRKLETEALEKALLNDDTVISTGGGIVKFSRNIELAKKAGGHIVFIDRPLDLIIGDIDTSERPLLKEGADRLKNLYSERYELYRSAADEIIENNAGLEDITQRICRINLDQKEKRKNI